MQHTTSKIISEGPDNTRSTTYTSLHCIVACSAARLATTCRPHVPNHMQTHVAFLSDSQLSAAAQAGRNLYFRWPYSITCV